MYLLSFALLAAPLLSCTKAQLSSPIAHNDHVSVAGNKFLAREATPSPISWSRGDESDGDECPQNLQLKWLTEASASIYATPLIADLHADGFKDIIVPSFVNNVEVLQGDNGAQAAGWPGAHSGKAHASPLMHDIDHDGVLDVLVATYDGEVLFFTESGERMAVKLTVPGLQVKRDWYEGLLPDHVDHSHPDVPGGANSGARNASADTGASRGGAQQHAGAQIGLSDLQREILEHHDALLGARARPTPREVAGEEVIENFPAQAAGRQAPRLQVPPENLRPIAPDRPVAPDRLRPDRADGAQSTGARVDGEATLEGRRRALLAESTAEEDPDGGLSEEAANAAGGLEDEWDQEDEQNAVKQQDWGEESTVSDFDYFDALGHGGEQQQDWTDWAAATSRLRNAPSRHNSGSLGILDGLYDYLDGVAYQSGPDSWHDEFHSIRDHGAPPAYVTVDPHILATPALGDLDGDGAAELVVPVSYYFDRSYYALSSAQAELPPGLDQGMYVASGVVAFELSTRAVKWSVHLDLTTDRVDYRAYAYSAPTLVDLDHDGMLEVVIGTSVGFVYVLNRFGQTMRGWPQQMGDVQAQVAAADVDGDGWLELLALDARGSAALFNASGALRWDIHTGGAAAAAATFGDVDGDGRLDATWGTATGEVHAVVAATGEALPGFPFQTSGRIMAQVTPVRLVDTPGLQLLAPSFDGFLYVIDGQSSCADIVDIGDIVYAAPLVDDLDNDGALEVLVATMSGNVLSLGTPAAYHPLRTWPAAVAGSSCFVQRDKWAGIAATAGTRAPKDMRGLSMPVEFTIFDRLAPVAAQSGASTAELKSPNAPYQVKVLLASMETAAMNSGEHPIIGMADTFYRPGTYTLTLPCPRSRATGLIRLEMLDANGVVYVDEFAQSFHMHFYRLLKWLVAAPLLALGLFLLVLQPASDSVLPV